MALAHTSNPRFVYIHPAKTGGNSVRRMLGELFGDTVEVHGGHSNVRDTRRHFADEGNIDMLERAYWFATVRNPFDLCLSLYAYIRRAPGHPWFDDWNRRTFREAMEIWCVSKMIVEDPQRPAGVNHWETQHQTLMDENANIAIDWIRTEELAEGMHRVCKRLGVKRPGVPHANQSNNRSRDYREAYNKATRRIVERAYRRDLEVFGYSF